MKKLDPVPLEYCVTWLELWLCGVVVFVDRAGGDGFSADGSLVVEVGHVVGGLRCDVRGALLPGLVRPVLVVAAP